MNMLQLALLILGILIIVGVIINALRERRRDSMGATKWTPPGRGPGAGKGLPLGDQMDIFGSSAGEFDEFGVGRPRKVKDGEVAAPAAVRSPARHPSPQPAQAPEAPTPPSAAPEATAPSKSRKTPTLSGERDEPATPSAPLPPEQWPAAHAQWRQADGRREADRKGARGAGARTVRA